MNLEDSTDVISITFNKEGFVSSSLSGTSADGNTAMDAGEPNIVFMEATAFDPCQNQQFIQDPNQCNGDDDGGYTGGGGTSQFCQEVGGRGEPTGGPISGNQTYFVIESIRLGAGGDGDGAMEVKMFVKNDDDYDNECFPVSYKYRFDFHNYYDCYVCDVPHITGADGLVYRVPDINRNDKTYSRFDQCTGSFAGDCFVTGSNAADFFPLFDLTHNPGPWRFILVETDRDYRDFSTRRSSEPRVKDVLTYDMSSNSWQVIKTGLSSDSHHYRSSDDIIPNSGFRRITMNNAVNRSNANGDIFVHSPYVLSLARDGYFKYRFSLRTY